MTAPDRPDAPDGWITSGAGFGQMQRRTDDDVRALIRRPYENIFGGVRESLRDGLLGSIGDIFRDLEPRLPDLDFLREAWVDGQQEIKDLWTRLSPLEEYASAYADNGSGFNQTGKVRFDNILTGSIGVTPVDGGLRLDDYGMWRIDSQIWASYWVQTTTGIPDPLPRIRWELRVLRPDGSIYHRRLGNGYYGNCQAQMPLSTTVVTPEAGYIVELHVTWIVAGRDLLGGSDRTHLTVHHINREPADIPTDTDPNEGER